MKESLVSGTFDLIEIFKNELTILIQHELFGNDTFQKVLKHIFFNLYNITSHLHHNTHYFDQ